VLLVLLLGWQLTVLARQGIAALYAASAEHYRQEAVAERDEGQARALRSRSLALVEKAVALQGANPDYRLLAATLLADSEAAEAQMQIRSHLRAGLASAPTRADLWARLARSLYSHEGTSPATLHALDQALYFGPMEIEPLLINALLTFYGWEGLNQQQRLNGWLHVVAAMQVPVLVGPITTHARATGWERQLQQLLREKRREAELRAQRQAEGNAP